MLKLYPDRLQITITERQAFALWQKDGHVSVIAADGTVLEPFVEDRYLGLPLVVGTWRRTASQGFPRRSSIVTPTSRAVLRASIMVARAALEPAADQRHRRAPAGIQCRGALDRLVALDRDKKLLSRDITMIDLRLPDRVTVRLSDAAAQARDEALKANTKKKKAGDA